MKHFTVPNSFLKLPKLSNLPEKPSQDYKYPLQGQIHSQKYILLIEDILLEDDRDNWKNKMEDILHGNAIVNELSTLSFNQFLDFIIHIAYANSQIDWNSISILEQFVEKELDHVSRWHLPDLDFEEDILAFYTSRVPNEITSEMINKIKEVQSIIRKSPLPIDPNRVISEEMIEQFISNEYLNLGEYYEFLANLATLRNSGLIEYDQFPTLMDELYEIWYQLHKKRKFDTFEKIVLFNLHSVMIKLTDSPDNLKSCQDLLNLTISELSGLSKEKQKSFLWLVDSVKAMVVNEVTKYKMELVTEDLLLRSIGDRFLNPENTDLKTWMFAIETTDLPLWTIITMLRGYLAVEDILHRYYSELPKSDNNNLITINNFLSSMLKGFESNFLNGNGRKLVDLPFHAEFYLTDSWVKTSFFRLKISPLDNYQEEHKILDRIKSSQFYDYYEMYLLCMDILSGAYPFAEYLERIKFFGESDEFLHLIGNEEFAEIFVDQFAKIFNFAQQQQINGGSYPFEKYSLMVFFIQSWFPVILKIEELVHDTIIIFLSFFKVIANLIENYFTKKNRLKNAQLWNLNYNLFELTLYFLYGYPELRNINKMLSKEHLFDDFLKMLKQFKLRDLVTTVDTRYLALDTRYDVSTFKLNHELPSLKPEKLHEDKIMEYLELQGTLQGFLHQLEDSDLNKVKEVLFNNPFKARDPPLTLLDKISQKEDNILHFPIIQPINAYAAAIQFFNLEIDFKIDELLS